MVGGPNCKDGGAASRNDDEGMKAMVRLFGTKQEVAGCLGVEEERG